MNQYRMTPQAVAAILLLYGGLFVAIKMMSKRVEPEERKTFWVVGGIWFLSVFVGNYGFFRIGIMSFLPWINNFLHTFVWIGGCLTTLYLGVRKQHGLAAQCIAFATFSLVVKYAEQMLFGIWDLKHFFFVFQGNLAYVLGWSLADGLYPILTLYGLRLLARRVPGLVAI